MEETTVIQEFEGLAKSFGISNPIDKPATLATLVTGSAIAYAISDLADAIWNLLPDDEASNDEDASCAMPGGSQAFTVDELREASTPDQDGNYLDIETLAAAEGGVLVRLNAAEVDLLLSAGQENCEDKAA